MSYDSAKKERDQVIEKLNGMELRLKGNSFDKSDLLELIKINKELVYRAYYKEIQEEEAEKLHEQIMNEMDPWDFQ
ncbi:hypothetical protein P59_064 [Bacillus phage P59]|nr:hypothetical protein P59_064 [Bacillus phage P59]